MSRAAWAGVLLIGAAFGLVAWLLTRGLPDDAVTRLEETRQAVAAASATLDEQETAINEAVKTDPSYMEASLTVRNARASLAERRKKLAAIDAAVGAPADAILEKDSAGDADQIFSLAATVRTDLQGVLKDAHTDLAQVQKVLRYKQEHPRLVEAARAAAARVALPGPDAQLELAISAAVAECPSTQQALRKKQAAVNALAQKIRTGTTTLERELATGTPNYEITGPMAESISRSARSLEQARADIERGIAALSTSKDRILEDMKTERGRYYHKYKVVEGGQARTTDWKDVPAATYQKHRDHLGMALESKPECVLPEDAVTVASPPGYAYVGNSRYGRWRQDGSGNRFWEWYGKYAFFRAVFFPGYSRPIGYNSWNTWRGGYRSGRVYYGPRNEWGSRGSYTRTRYAGSRYMKTAASRRSTSSSRNTTSYRNSGTRRSGGNFRTSRYRGRSSFGGGK